MRTTMSKRLTDNLLAVAEAFCAAKPCGMSSLGLWAHGNSTFFVNLRGAAAFAERNGSYTVRKYDEVMAWLSSHWPKGARWPSGVERPSPAAVYETMNAKVASARVAAPRRRGATA
jgi:hypothetical protein